MKRFILKEILVFSEKYLEKKGVVNPKYSAEEIIANILGCSRSDLFFKMNEPLKEWRKVFSYLRRRGYHEPLEYIFNKSFFYNTELYVDENVLIPRSETEQLVDLVIKNLKDYDLQKKICVWDICTGSGAIAIALKKAENSLDMTAGDISEKALEIAKKNAKKNGCKINFRLSDLLTEFKGLKADIVVSNPPYVSFEEYNGLMSDVKDFEPKIALVASNEGLFFYKKLIDELPMFLNPGGKVFFEIGEGQGSKLLDMVKDEKWTSKKIYKDFAGKDRFFFLEIE